MSGRTYVVTGVMIHEETGKVPDERADTKHRAELGRKKIHTERGAGTRNENVRARVNANREAEEGRRGAHAHDVHRRVGAYKAGSEDQMDREGE